jgi:hypothetical protein
MNNPRRANPAILVRYVGAGAGGGGGRGVCIVEIPELIVLDDSHEKLEIQMVQRSCKNLAAFVIDKLLTLSADSVFLIV